MKDLEYTRFNDLVGDIIRAVYAGNEHELDPVVLDSYTFRAIGSYVLDLEPRQVHNVWVRAQIEAGWSYNETADLDRMMHPLVRETDDETAIDARYTRADAVIAAVCQCYASGITTGLNAAMQPMIIMCQLLRSHLFQNSPAPHEFVGKVREQVDRLVKIALEPFELPEFFSTPLRTVLLDTLTLSLANDMKEKTDA